MEKIVIPMTNRQYSTMFFAGSLVKEVARYSSEVVLMSVSENKVSQQIDLKSYLATMGVLYNTADELIIEVRGDNEAYEARHLERIINKLLEESAK